MNFLVAEVARLPNDSRRLSEVWRLLLRLTAGMIGILSVDKPAGVTSRDVVNRIQRLVRPAKVGHAGTLDPLATGVLVVCVGKATRLIEYVQRMPKRYRGTFLLGRQSETDDVEGEVIALDAPPVPPREEIEAALPQFTGRIQQRPPTYSALKVQGRRAYDLARKGESVELAPREVEIHKLQLVAYDYPELTLDVECGGGTYIRAIGRDLAEMLGTAAVMSALRRTAVGKFTVDEALPLERIVSDQNPSDSIERRDVGVGAKQAKTERITHLLLPAARAVSYLPRVKLTHEELVRVAQGRTIEDTRGLSGEVAAFSPEGELAAILTAERGGPLRPHRWLGPTL